MSGYEAKLIQAELIKMRIDLKIIARKESLKGNDSFEIIKHSTKGWSYDYYIETDKGEIQFDVYNKHIDMTLMRDDSLKWSGVRLTLEDLKPRKIFDTIIDLEKRVR